MPAVLRIEYDPYSKYCTLHHPYSKRFVDFLKLGVKPTSYRRYDPGTKEWMVHKDRLAAVISYGRKCFAHVDYRALPPDLQIEVVRKIEDHRSRPSMPFIVEGLVKATPRGTLFVAENAPWEVVKAAYRALASMYHPDHGGDADLFREIQEAYETVKKDLKK